MSNSQKLSNKATIISIGIIVVMTGIIVVMTFLVSIIVKSCNSPDFPNSPETENTQSSQIFYKEEIVTKLMFDNYTPCNPTFNYDFELDTQGDSISMKFPGIDLIYYSGKGTLKVPPRESGPVVIKSMNPNEVRVRIWRVIKIKI